MAKGKKNKPVTSEAASRLDTVDPVSLEILEAEVVEGTDELDAQEPVLETEPIEAEVLVDEDLPLGEEESTATGEIEPLSESAEPASAIARYDPVDAYLREIRVYPPLSREEEHALAVKYLTEKDREAAYKLVTSNLWLVVKIARDYERAARGLLDLVQEGNIGLMEAVRNYDPYRGVRFPSYAVWWIKAYIIRYLIANWRLVKIGTTQAQRKLFFNLKKEKERLEREGFTPAPKLLAEKLNVKESEVVEMEQRLGSSDMSVDAPITSGRDRGASDRDTSLLSMLPAAQPTAEEALDEKRSKELLRDGLAAFAKTLKEKERIIFEERMLGEDKATLQDISEKVGVSRERVRQIENRLREKLKEFLTERLGSALETMEF
jgi:RNA polymerase sigma-32 factor